VLFRSRGKRLRHTHTTTPATSGAITAATIVRIPRAYVSRRSATRTRVPTVALWSLGSASPLGAPVASVTYVLAERLDLLVKNLAAGRVDNPFDVDVLTAIESLEPAYRDPARAVETFAEQELETVAMALPWLRSTDPNVHRARVSIPPAATRGRGEAARYRAGALPEP